MASDRPVRLHNPATGTSVTVGGPAVALMGVINRSPESHQTDVYAASPDQALRLADRYRASGVSVIDVGGQSTNFENPEIDEATETDRLVPTVRALVADGHVVSVDTWKPAVAEACLHAGAALINDTRGLRDPEMVAVVARYESPVVLMHLAAEHPLDVGAFESGPGAVDRIAAALGSRLETGRAAGISQVILDPGVAISYRTDYDAYSRAQFEVAEHLDRLTVLGPPVLYAVPRKADRHRNVALAALAMAGGAAMLRIHDVEMIADIARLMRRLPGLTGDGREEASA